MEGERHDTKRQGEADGERSAEKAMVEGRDGRTKEGRGGRAARTDREQTAPAGHFETFAKNASYMGGLREGWIEKHSNKEEATGGTGRGCSDVTHTHTHTHTHTKRVRSRSQREAGRTRGGVV